MSICEHQGMGIVNSTLRRLVLIGVACLIVSPAAVAQQKTYNDTRKPELFYQLMSGLTPSNANPYFETLGEAWSMFRAFQSNACASSPYPEVSSCGSFTGLRQCGIGAPDNVSYFFWGVADRWCHDWSYSDRARNTYSGTTSVIYAYWKCPDGYTLSAWYVVSGTGQAGDPRRYNAYCSKPVPEVPCNQCGKGNPIYPSIGTKRQFESDYDPGTGSLSFRRTYDSSYGTFRSEFDVDFQQPTPWAVSTNQCIASLVTLQNPSVASDKKLLSRCFPATNFPGTKAAFLGPDRARKEFTFSAGVWSPSANYVKDRLASIVSGGATSWLLSRRDEGEILLFDAAGRLIRRQGIDGRGVSLTYSPTTGYLSAVTDDFGRTITVNNSDLNGRSRLDSIVDPEGSITGYAYNAVQQMIGVTHADLATKGYVWDEAALSTGTNRGLNRLTGIVDEIGVRYATFGYLNGAAIRTEHIGGVDKYSVNDSRSAGTGTLVVTYPSGAAYSSTYALVNGFSRETAFSQPAGSGSAAASGSKTYDANGNLASANDLNGNRNCYANDLTTNLESSRVEGLAAAVACSTVTANGATLPSGSRKTSRRWHPDWKLETARAEPGKLTAYVYNGQPDPFNSNALASCAPSTALLPDGKPIVVLCKKVEQATTDADGRLGFGASLQGGVANRQSSYTYNQLGQVLTIKGPRTDVDDTTTFVYYSDTTADHTAGDLSQVTNALGASTQFTRYNKRGQALRAVDANGVVTDYDYDARARLKSVSVGGQTTSYDYHPTGLLRRVTQPDATSYIEYGYDQAHRLINVTDNLGNRIDYTLDSAGNRVAERVSGLDAATTRQLSRAVDALGRVQQVTGRE
jgi:YD repeat-containing protein